MLTENRFVMSFYVDSQIEALQIGISHLRPDLATLTLDELKQHPNVEVKTEKITNPFDFEGKYAQEAISISIKDQPFKILSAPFRTGFDIWMVNKETGFGIRL